MSNQIILTVIRPKGASAAEQAARFNVNTGSGQALHIQAAALADYQLADAATGLAPENLEFTREGDNLHIRDKASASARPDIVIENYYTHTTGNIKGLQANGSLAAYEGEIPAKSVTAEQVTVHQNNGGGVNKLAVTLGGLAGAGLLGALAGGGGGGGGSDQAPAAAATQRSTSSTTAQTAASSANTAANAQTATSSNTAAQTNAATEAATASVAGKETEQTAADSATSSGSTVSDTQNTASGNTTAPVNTPSETVLASDKETGQTAVDSTTSSESAAADTQNTASGSTSMPANTPPETVSASNKETEQAAADSSTSSDSTASDTQNTASGSTTTPVNTPPETVSASDKETGQTAADSATSSESAAADTQNTASGSTTVTDDTAANSNDSATETTPTETVATDTPAAVSDGQTATQNGYRVYEHPQYGKYIDAAEFGTDPSGQTDSLAAITAALAAAHKESAAVYLSGSLYISNQIVLNKANSGVTALFGDGMGKTTISFDKAQTGVFDPNSNETEVRPFAGILIDGQSNKTIADLSVKYTNPDFYRTGESYFGKVNGILVNDADNTLISKVEVSGANRAGVFFTSTQTLQPDPDSSIGRTYKARLIRGEVDETYENLPLGENNRIVDSYLHHNRVAGVLLAYQKDFTADGNTMSWNGHEADGGTGYGIASMAGSYNYGITYTNNTTDHNYRKGLDIHDGDDIVIENNTSIGDRLNGIAVYNRQFTMDTVKVSNNTIVADPDFRLAQDDNVGLKYFGYSGIQIQTNTMFRDLRSSDTGDFKISGNTIKNLDVYQNAIQTYGIEFRNHEPNMHYKLDITGNTIEGESTMYAVAVINNTKNKAMNTNGQGSGTINVVDNTIDIAKIPRGTLPVFINEESNNGQLRGEVTVSGNSLTIREKSDGTIEGIQMVGNAETYHVTDNTFEVHGTMDKPIISLLGRAGSEIPELFVSGNDITTDLTGKLYRGWIERNKVVDVYAENNTHNDTDLADERTIVSAPAAGYAPETAETVETAHVLDLGIGSNTISGTDQAAYKQTETAETATASESTAEISEQLSDGLPALNDLLAVTELDLSAVLGAESGAGLAVGATVTEYAQSVNIYEEQWQSEVSAYIV
ncbi:right-handed parallel beta-helix repeat-containing protein [Neisseria dentiae]|uniref:right-handed parallel beta-helix repeat-containing protein n=1 Tax=Neisseria dentiae TaxID=194197 RepID=UPI00211C692D|nr:right-handed parallel beta-helix repeat-containing protein [Neisseria dentiae]MCQ9326858.1 right-handed parallel beta-helix repeat-containing protein [Neisseria dentiae]